MIQSNHMREHGQVVDLTKHIVKNKFPSELYPSTVGIYGGEIKTDTEGKMFYSQKGFTNQLDIYGDSVLRKFDDHVLKEPLKLLIKHPKTFLDITFNSEPPRHRGSISEILENIQRLGLEEFYGPHPQGIEIKKPEVFKKGIALGDIFRIDQSKYPILADIDRFQALGEAVKYLNNMHQKYGAGGDIVDDFIFQQKNGSRVLNPTIDIPDIVFTPSKRRTNFLKKTLSSAGLSEPEIESKIKDIFNREQKATEMGELMISTAFQEFRRSGDPNMVNKALNTIVENYEDKNVLHLTRLFVQRGRFTLPDSKSGGLMSRLFNLHNQAHLGANKEKSPIVRKMVINNLKF